jgi:hypothetical protein
MEVKFGVIWKQTIGHKVKRSWLYTFPVTSLWRIYSNYTLY